MYMDIKIERTNILPLRWLANYICEPIANFFILKIWDLSEQNKIGFRYKLYCFIWDITWPIYSKYGTYYQIPDDLGGSGWDDYDENGIPYWDYFWHEDPITGDAWRLVDKNGN